MANAHVAQNSRQRMMTKLDVFLKPAVIKTKLSRLTACVMIAKKEQNLQQIRESVTGNHVTIDKSSLLMDGA